MLENEVLEVKNLLSQKLAMGLFTTSVSLGKGRGQHAVIKLQGGGGGGGGDA